VLVVEWCCLLVINYHFQDLLKTFLLLFIFHEHVQTRLLVSIFKHQDGYLVCIPIKNFLDDGAENLLLFDNVMEYGFAMERVKVEALVKPRIILDKDPNGFFVPIIELFLLTDTSGSNIRPELQLLLINGVEDFASRRGQVVDDALVFFKLQVLGDLWREIGGFLRFFLWEDHELFDVQITFECTLHDNVVFLLNTI
jgi:hypothetical protein